MSLSVRERDRTNKRQSNTTYIVLAGVTMGINSIVLDGALQKNKYWGQSVQTYIEIISASDLSNDDKIELIDVGEKIPESIMQTCIDHIEIYP